MQRLEVSGAVRLIYRTIGVKGLRVGQLQSITQQCISTRFLLENDKNYMFRPLLAIIRFLIQKKYMLEEFSFGWETWWWSIMAETCSFLSSSNKHLVEIHYCVIDLITLPLITTHNGDGKFQNPVLLDTNYSMPQMYGTPWRLRTKKAGKLSVEFRSSVSISFP